MAAAINQAAVDPNSGTASFKTALMATLSSSGNRLLERCDPFPQRLHWRLIRLGRHNAGNTDSIVGSSLANRISFNRSPGRMPVKTISMSWPGCSARKPDHALSEIDDPNRLSHVEHVN